MATVLGVAFMVPGTIWVLLQRWLDRGDETSSVHPAVDVEPATETSMPQV
jgi:hypothetical protein